MHAHVFTAAANGAFFGAIVKKRGLCFAALAALWLLVLAIPAYAAEQVDYLKEMEQALPPGLYGEVSFASTEDLVRQTGLPYLLQKIKDAVNGNAGRALGAFACFSGLAVLGALCNMLFDKEENGELKEILERAVCAFAALTVFSWPCI